MRKTRLFLIAALIIGVLFAPFMSAAPATAATDVRSVGNFYIGFNKSAPAGKVDSTYPGYWQPYPNGMSDKYYADEIISLHNGYMDVAVDGKRGAAGTFGSPSKAYSHVGGTFSIRMKATGGAGNGIAVMLWPSSDTWSDGEVDFPEGNFEHRPHVYHHLMIPGREGESINTTTNVSWADWHTYTMQWKPGKYVKYYVDNKLVFTVTSNVPTTPHRYMFQVGNYGKPGHILIDSVRTTEP